jgi:hypothetical protein
MEASYSHRIYAHGIILISLRQFFVAKFLQTVWKLAFRWHLWNAWTPLNEGAMTSL